MKPDEARARMEKINEQIGILRDAFRRYDLIASGAIESTEEITIQSTKAEVALDSVDTGVIKEAITEVLADVKPV